MLDNMSTIYIDRNEASKILNVSTRTLDRYVRKYRLKTRKDGRRILIKRAEINKIINEHVGHFVDISSTSNVDKKSVHNRVDETSNISVQDVKVESVKKGGYEEEIYKNLFQETKKELKDKQERLEAATYRVGQLEAQLKNMVPLLDFSRKEKELKEVQGTIEQKELEKEQLARQMQRRIRAEIIAKYIYLTLVGLLLVAEPILFLLWAFS